MVVIGRCRLCGVSFSSHWNDFPGRDSLDAILRPACPNCGSREVRVTTDESHESPRGDDGEDFAEEA